MSLDLPDALIEILILPLTELFLAVSGSDRAAAKADALKLIEAYDPKTVIELRLAVRVGLLNVRANQAISHASTPGLPPPVATRLTGHGLSLIREADKAERRLETRKAERPQTPEEQVPEGQKPEGQKPEEQVPEGQTPEERRQQAPEPDLGAEAPSRDPATVAAEIRQITTHAEANGIPFVKAYKQRKIEQREARRQERDARLQAASYPGIP
jgi:outer membrane biosynthesis protein TonB